MTALCSCTQGCLTELHTHVGTHTIRTFVREYMYSQYVSIS